MMDKIYKWLPMCILCMLVGMKSVNAQTLHTIVFCNTIDRSIGQSMRIIAVR